MNRIVLVKWRGTCKVMGAADARNHESIVHEIGFLVEEDGEHIGLVPSWHQLPNAKEVVLVSPNKIPKHCIVEIKEVPVS